MGKIIMSALFKNKREELLKIVPERMEKPPSPICAVGQNTCRIVDIGRSIHHLYLIPMLLGFCWLYGMFIYDFYDSWKGAEISLIDSYRSQKKIHGEKFYETTKDPEVRKWRNTLNMLVADEKLSLKEYLYHRYHGYVASKELFYTDILWTIFGVIIVPGYGIWVLSLRRRAPLFFDRERRMVYTWRSGKVCVQRYDDLYVLETPRNFTFLLRGFAKTGELGILKFKTSPSGNHMFNSISSYQPFLTFIVRFMEYGLNNVFPKGEWKAKPSFYFYGDWFYLLVDKKPKDFEEQLESVLQKIDEERAGKS